MNQSKLLRICPLELRLQRWVAGQKLHTHKEQRVLRIPPLDRFVLPDPLPNEIHEYIATLFEKFCPLVGPLFVDMVIPALKRDGRGEQDRWCQTRKRIDKLAGTISW